MRGRTACLLTTAVVAMGLAWTSPRTVNADTSTECAAGTDTASLNRLIANQLADSAGFAPTRAIPMPAGRRAGWTVQDVFISSAPGERAASLRVPTGFAHNALIVQEGNCFTTLHGPI